MFLALKKEAESLGLSLRLTGNAELCPVGSEALKDRPDFVLFWDKDVRLAFQLERLGIPVFNSAKSIALCDDKTLTWLALAGDVPMLVNKTHTVDEFFTPADLVKLKDVLGTKLVKVKYKNTMGVRTAVEALKAMLEAAKADGLGKKWQISAGYRTWDQQVSMLNQKTSAYKKKNKGWSSSKARRAALRSVAEPGSSEHHLGLAFDINKQGSSNFAGTKHSAWLNEHCWEYGFIIRYQKEKEEITGFIAEPWHIRYVGVEHAKYMKEHNLCLEEYIQGIENGTIVIGGGAAEAPAEEGNTEEETAEEPADSEAPEDTGDGAEDAGTPDDLLEDLPEDSDEEPDEGAAA